MKQFNKALRLLLIAALLVALSAGVALAAEDTLLIATNPNAGLGQPTPLTDDNKGVADAAKGNGLAKNGYFTQDIQVGQVTRTAKIYIGTDAPIRCYFTVLNVPDGVETAEFLENTGWAALAEERGEGLFVLEPGEGGWGTYEQEADYLTAAFKAYNTKTWYSNFSTSYVIGYGVGGQALQCYTMANSMAMIGGVFIDASEISGEYLAQVAATKCKDSEITLGQVPMPVWLINENSTPENQEVISYWKAANDCVASGTRKSDGSLVFAQKADSDSIVTSYSDTRSQVRVLTAKADIYSAAFTQELYDYLDDYTRYETNVVAGNSLGARPDYEKLGIDICQLTMDGLVREYIVYVPESVKKANDKVPMVLLMGGSGQPNRVIFDATHWWEIAEKEGFIIVSPCAYSQELRWNNTGTSENRDDLKFIRTVLTQVEAKYPVDSTRIYATGQSNGAVMTEFLALQAPELFAAAGATSGGLVEDSLYTTDNGKAAIPTYLLFGEFDNWDYDYKVEGKVRTLVSFFSQRNDASAVDDPDSQVAQGRFTTITWANEAGFPLVQLTQTQGRPHNCIPTEMELEWAYFKQWSRSADGALYFNGKLAVAAPEVKENPFADVAAEDYYAQAVKWAVDNNVTQGVSAVAFGPEQSCTRAQVVLFLWRAAGCPQPVGNDNPFTDMKAGAYYYDAAIWAVEQGILKGATADTFAPTATVTRAQFVTFLWRAAGSPQATAANPFADVSQADYFAAAALWAVEQNITTGVTATTFAPNDPCTRGQVVTFLFRAEK